LQQTTGEQDGVSEVELLSPHVVSATPAMVMSHTVRRSRAVERPSAFWPAVATVGGTILLVLLGLSVGFLGVLASGLRSL
jgi:hypothetical protein